MRKRNSELLKYTIFINKTIEAALSIINEGARSIVLVINKKKQLLGTVTDGDIRRAILNGKPLKTPIQKIMTSSPITVRENTPRQKIVGIFRKEQVAQIPIVDAHNRVLGLITWAELISSFPLPRNNYVYIPAGGFGRRLRPLTVKTPKPLLKIKERPIVSYIIEKLALEGFHNFILGLNYMADKFTKTLGNGESIGVKIDYIFERKPLGTIGGLALAKDRLRSPFLVVNADVLTQMPFGKFFDFHMKEKFDMTIALKTYDMQLPYGTVKIKKKKILMLEEKPTKSFLVNSGMYVVNPKLIKLIPKGKPMSMTDFIQKAIKEKYNVGGFPVNNYWVDIGQPKDYSYAMNSYLEASEHEK